MVVHLTNAEWVHLCGVKMYSHEGSRLTEMTGRYRTAVLSSLVRKGLIQSHAQSEQVRGERRAYWRPYKITSAGLARLAHGAENVSPPSVPAADKRGAA